MENTPSHDPRSTYILAEGKRPGKARIVNRGTIRDVKKNAIKIHGVPGRGYPDITGQGLVNLTGIQCLDVLAGDRGEILTLQHRS